MARDPTARWGAAAFAAAGLGFGALTLGRALTIGHLTLAVPLWVELAEGVWLWLAWTAWGAVTVAQWAARRRGRVWWGAGAALGAGGVAVPTALVCTVSCGVAGGVGLGTLASVGVAMTLAAWLPWLWGAAAALLTVLTCRYFNVSPVNKEVLMAHSPSTPRWNWATKEVTVLGVALALTLGTFGGYLVGHGASALSTSAPVASPTPSAAPSGGSTSPSGSSTAAGASAATFTVNHSAPWSTPLDTLTGQSGHLVRGTKGTLVVEMASWCLYCGYTDKYIVPVIARMPGVAVDVVDVSTQGGIANPGPANPPFSGHDGQGGPITTAQMETTMQQYVRTYGTLGQAHVFVAPSATRTAWAVQSFPTLTWINAAGTVVSSSPGALTLAQAQAEAKSLGF